MGVASSGIDEFADVTTRPTGRVIEDLSKLPRKRAS
jgi:hypothetical protein